MTDTMEKVSVWRANLTSGIIMGLIGVVYSLIMYFMDLTFNKAQGYVILVVFVFLLYYLVRSYRNNYQHGYISYGKAVGAGAIIWLYYSVIAAVFTYILYTVIDPGLTSKQLAFTEELLLKKGTPQQAIDAAMAMQTKILKPVIIAPLSILMNMLYGTIVSLIVSIFLKKEGNPLVDIPEN
jgi:hypothetical protein